MTTTSSSSFTLDQFVSEFWTEYACNPENWCYTPSTYGIDGVELVGDPHMILWAIMNAWKNPGRAFGADLGQVDKLEDDVVEHGIDTDKPMIYFDVDNMERINGEHRFLLSNKLGIPGWMGQGVRFANEAAKIKFALASNKKREDVYNPPSREDVESAIRALIALGALVTDEDIKEEVRFLGKGAISETAIKSICNQLIAERIFSGKITAETRFTEWNDDKLNVFFKNTDDQWVDDYWDNTSEYTMYINMNNFDSRINSLINMAAQATAANKPLHLLISVKLYQKQELDTTRSKVFTDNLKGVERQICTIMGMIHERCGSNFPWNHPECEHRFLAQDLQHEDPKQLYYLIWD
jgi:hypothetical protein